MTWTVFEHQYGDNETDDDSPGRGGYKYVLFEGTIEVALWWWTWTYGEYPERGVMPDPHDDPAWLEKAWSVEKMSKKAARRAPGEKTLDKGGVGVPYTETFTWDELRGRLDVKVVEREDFEDG
jgi:hypothetical protein